MGHAVPDGLRRVVLPGALYLPALALTSAAGRFLAEVAHDSEHQPQAAVEEVPPQQRH